MDEQGEGGPEEGKKHIGVKIKRLEGSTNTHSHQKGKGEGDLKENIMQNRKNERTVMGEKALRERKETVQRCTIGGRLAGATVLQLAKKKRFLELHRGAKKTGSGLLSRELSR